MPGLVSARELDRAKSDQLISRASRFLDEGGGPLLAGSVIGLLFYSDSLRTRAGFEVAAANLSARTFVVSGARHTPVMSMAEPVQDAVRSIAGWCDAICVRHPDATLVGELAELIDVPIVNCGNGEDEHPTQALADVFAISRIRGSIDGLRLAVVGDLAGMRAVHSLMLLLGNYRDVFVRCVSPPGLQMPVQYLGGFASSTNTIEHSARARLDDVEVVYVAGLPRHTRVEVSDADRAHLSVTREALRRARPGVRVLCPLPRIDEIAQEVDATPEAFYFEQSRLALFMRMAILTELVRPPR